MTDRFFSADGVKIAFEVAGDGPPIVLVHGFASNRLTNWISPGWVRTLTNAGRRVIALDCRGHGRSDKPHSREAYDEGIMAADVRHLLDHLGLEQADYMGYSMGAFIGLRALADFPKRLDRVILAGIGTNYLANGAAQAEAIAAGLLAPSLSDVTEAIPRQFRIFAEKSGNDLKALAACMLRPRMTVPAETLGRTVNRVLLITGEHDTISGPTAPLGAQIAGVVETIVPKRDHMTAVGDPAFKHAVLDFLAK